LSFNFLILVVLTRIDEKVKFTKV